MDCGECGHEMPPTVDALAASLGAPVLVCSVCMHRAEHRSTSMPVPREQLNVRVPRGTVAQLAANARQAKLTLNAYVCGLLGAED